jgi:glycogen debranching enzyme
VATLLPVTQPDGQWLLTTEPATLGNLRDLLMLVEGQTFCVSDRAGEIRTGSPHGLFHADTRVLSTARLSISGRSVESLAVAPDGSSGASVVGRVRVDSPDGPVHVLVVRRRRVGELLDETIEVRHSGAGPLLCSMRLVLDADFADVFAVKENRVVPRGRRAVEVRRDQLLYEWHFGRIRRRVRIRASGPGVVVDATSAHWQFEVPPRGSVRCRWSVDAAVGDQQFGRRSHPSLAGDLAHTGTRFDQWVADAPTLTTDLDPLRHAYTRSVDDVGALRLFDPDDPSRLPVVAAGAPWFMTLFGRDAIITALMCLPIDPTLGLGVAQALARLQGVTADPRTEEEPGRIMHELRFDASTGLGLEAGETYYGSVDATPLFVVLVDHLHRYGLPDTALDELLPHVDRALTWITDTGDRDGDGYVEYQRSTPTGLANQGWKDSWDGVRYHNGRVAEAPIALCEVQGYAYAAFLGRARIARIRANEAEATRWEAAAARLKTAFNRDFWIERLGWYAVGLDGDKRPIDALASNIGHCLWSGVVDDEHAEQVAHHLLSAPMWTGWGVRTLAADEPAYSPMSYHCGSVWPHDNALLVAGLRRYGFIDAAHTVSLGVLDAATAAGGRLPELFCGLDRVDIGVPVPFPTSCSPQAWAAATPFLLLQTLLGLEPDVPAGRLSIEPALPRGTTRLELRGARLWSHRLDIVMHDGNLDVHGTDGLTVESIRPR